MLKTKTDKKWIIEVILIQTIDGNTDIGAMIIAIYTTIMYFTIFFMFLPL